MMVLDLTFPLGRWIPWPWTLLGTAPILLGFAVASSGRRRFRHHDTPVRPFEPSRALVTDGVFRYTRNPMYGGLLLVLAGTGVLLGTISPLLVIPVFLGLIEWRFVRGEEAFLQERFGAAYREYRARVRRWL